MPSHPTGPVKAVAALARTIVAGSSVAVTGPAWVLLPSPSVAPSVQELDGIRVQLGHIPLLPRIILP